MLIGFWTHRRGSTRLPGQHKLGTNPAPRPRAIVCLNDFTTDDASQAK